jgi:hypothetical protein
MRQWGLLAVVGLAACATQAKGPASPAAPIGHGGWGYEVVADAHARELAVVADFPVGTHEALSVDDQATRFVRDVALREGDAWRPLASEAGVWRAARCAQGCQVRYRFLLADAASALDDVNLATAYHGAIEAPPSSWLLRPTQFTRGIAYRFHVQTPEGTSFATGVTRAKDGRDTYEADVGDLELAPYSVFGTLRTRSFATAGATIDLAILPGSLAMDDAALDRWIGLSARALVSFYGRFPQPRVLLAIVPSNGDDVGGKTLASGGASILLEVGSSMKPSAIDEDWVLAHEMIHLAFPSLPRRYVWLEEGLATYVEPIARAKAGIIRPEEVWRGLVNGLPKGEPEAGDRGLDNTPTWGRTYWGGALFCLMADIEIRRATGNKRSLEDALRGILVAGGNGAVRWDIARALAEGDRAIGVQVLQDLHAKMGRAPVKVDLPQLWAQLGVRPDGHRIAFDDAAPDAAIRRAITARAE